MNVLYMSYYVAPDNWTTATIAGIGTQSNPQYLYSINPNDSPSGDPAVGCNKTFNASYKCGDSTTVKTLTVPAEAKSYNAKFDCTTEFNKCSKLQLHLADTGVLTLVNSAAPTTILWTSTTPAIVNAVALPKYAPSAPTALLGNFAKDRSYLKSGEFLSNGQWLSSPGGKCRLEMTADGDTRTLQVVYEALACNATNDLNTESSLLYTIPSGNNANVGKIGYVNEQGQLQPYPNDMTYYDGIAYDLIGNYDVHDATTIATVSGDSVSDCKTACSNANTKDSSTQGNPCVGFVYGSGSCKLLDDTAFPVGAGLGSGGKRSIHSTHQLYMRTKGVSPDMSCPSDVNQTIIGTPANWQEFLPLGTNAGMTNETTCGISKWTANETDNQGVSNASLNSLAQSMRPVISNLLSKYNNLKSKLLNNKTKLNDSTNELQESRKNLADWSGDQLEQLEAMKEDRDLNMMSQNYKHIMWSILAIIIIIAVIYFTKTFAPEAAAAISSAVSDTAVSVPTASI